MKKEIVTAFVSSNRKRSWPTQPNRTCRFSRKHLAVGTIVGKPILLFLPKPPISCKVHVPGKCGVTGQGAIIHGEFLRNVKFTWHSAIA
jgi:hypothetical protein